MPARAGDDDGWWDQIAEAQSGPTGTATTLNFIPGRPRRVPKREFPPGFHVAAPGPSHPDPDNLPKTHRTAAKKARK